jgi:DNA polymerase III delta prime subunit
MNLNKENSLWTEQYRPSTLENYIGNEHMKDRIQYIIDTGEMVHLLFYGKPGTGKTSIAKIIANSLNADVLYINASDESGVDIIRDKIKGFASTMGFGNTKIIILDESDFMSSFGQAALRNVMETFSNNCKFILTCNYVEKIIPAIQSRCQSFQVTPPSKKDIAIHISKILTEKGIQFDVKDLVPIIDSSYPDIRKIINTCQLNSHKGVLKLDISAIVENDYKQKVLDILNSSVDKKTKYNTIRKALADSKVTDFTELYTFLYEKVDDFSPKSTSVSILTLSEGQYKSSLVIDKEIPMIATIINLLNTLD